MGRMMPRPRH